MSPEVGNVIVTGGASGLGAAVAAAIAPAGGTPVVLDLRPPVDGVTHRVVDLSDTASAAVAVRTVADGLGELHGVVTAAGTDCCGPLGDVTRASWERVVAVN